MWPYSVPLKNYPARQLCPECIGHLPPSTRDFSNLPCNVIWSLLSWSLYSTPDFLVASSTHLRALWPLLIFSAIDCPSRHLLFGIARSLSSCFYPSLFANLSTSLHLTPSFSHILSFLITLLWPVWPWCSVTHHQYAASKKVFSKQGTRKINSETLTNFQSLLKQETWQPVYQAQDTNNMFNVF